MNFEDLKDQIDNLEESDQELFQQLLSLVTWSGALMPEFAPCLEKAQDYREFFELVYADDTLRFTKVWGVYARTQNKNWLNRLKPISSRKNVELEEPGIVIGFDHGAIVVPVVGCDKKANVIVIDEEEFSKGVADYVSTISGKFSCYGMSFDGTYDVFTSRNIIVFEKWSMKDREQRAHVAQLSLKYRRAG